MSSKSVSEFIQTVDPNLSYKENQKNLYIRNFNSSEIYELLQYLNETKKDPLSLYIAKLIESTRYPNRSDYICAYVVCFILGHPSLEKRYYSFWCNKLRNLLDKKTLPQKFEQQFEDLYSNFSKQVVEYQQDINLKKEPRTLTGNSDEECSKEESQLSEVIGEIAKKKHEYEELCALVEKVKNELHKIEADYSEKEKIKCNLNLDLENMKNVYERLNSSITEIKEEIVNLSAEKERITKETIKQKSMIEKNKKQIDANKQKLNEQENEIHENEKKIKEGQKELIRIGSQIENIQQKKKDGKENPYSEKQVELDLPSFMK